MALNPMIRNVNHGYYLSLYQGW